MTFMKGHDMPADRFQLLLELSEDGKIKIHTEGPGMDNRMDPLGHSITWDGYKANVEHGVDSPMDLQAWADLKALAAAHEPEVPNVAPRSVRQLLAAYSARNDELLMANDDVISKQRKLIRALQVISEMQELILKAPAAYLTEELRGELLDLLSVFSEED